MAGRYFRSPFIGKLCGRCETASMINKCVAKANPQLRVPRVPLDGVLQNANGIFAFAIAGEGFRNAQPTFRRREIAEERMARVRQRKKIVGPGSLRWRARHVGVSPQSITRGADEKRCETGGQEPAADTLQSQKPKRGCNQCSEYEPARQFLVLKRMRRWISHVPIIRSASGASHSGQAANSLVGL